MMFKTCQHRRWLNIVFRAYPHVYVSLHHQLNQWWLSITWKLRAIIKWNLKKWITMQIYLATWDPSAACTLVTSFSNSCGDYKGDHHSSRLCAPGIPREYSLWCSMKGTLNLKLLLLWTIEWFLPFELHITITFSPENYYADCVVIANIFIDVSEDITALIFMEDCS